MTKTWHRLDLGNGMLAQRWVELDAEKMATRTGAGRPSISARNRAEACASRAGTMV